VVVTGGVSRGLALVVEDDEGSAELIRLLLTAEDFEVVHARTAEEALVLAPQRPLALITLDVHLPGMDGWEFLAAIREQSDLAEVPVVVIAGNVDSSLALTRGATAILQKPVRRAQLTASLAGLGLHSEPERTRTVLVVDDDPKAVELVAAFLPAPDFAVIRCYGGAEAVVLAKRLLPDLVLLDLMMPDVSGFDVVEALQQDPATSAIPILVVTAKQITAGDRTTLHGGTDQQISIVQKAGFDRQAFLADVRRALPTAGRGAPRGHDPRR
jgi:DNA-binding response OmpR family regulator